MHTFVVVKRTENGEGTLPAAGAGEAVHDVMTAMAFVSSFLFGDVFKVFVLPDQVTLFGGPFHIHHDGEDAFLILP